MRVLRRFLSVWQNWLGLLLLLMFVFVALAAPFLSPMDPKEPGVFKTVGRTTDNTPRPPSKDALLGTLSRQVDVYHTLIWGTRGAMLFGVTVAFGAFLFGTILGAISGYAGGILNSLIMRLSDAILTFPLIAGVAILQQFVAITIESMGGIFYFNLGSLGKVVYFQFDPPLWVNFLLKLDPLLICLVLFSWVPYTRLINTIIITLKRADFIQAVQALGGGPIWIIWRHLIPNSMGPALVLAARDVGNAVILQATFTFIGLGSTSAWGMLLFMGRDWIIGPGGNIFHFWWVFLPATLAVLLFGITWNIIGDGLSDALNPDSRGRFIKKEVSEEKQETDSIHRRPATIPLQARHSLESSPSPHKVTPLEVRNSIILQVARDAVVNRDLSKALEAYGFLVHHSRLPDIVISDLAALARLFPNEPLLWKTLGDALTSVGKCSYADKAYAQAEIVSQKQNRA